MRPITAGLIGTGGLAGVTAFFFMRLLFCRARAPPARVLPSAVSLGGLSQLQGPKAGVDSPAGGQRERGREAWLAVAPPAKQPLEKG